MDLELVRDLIDFWRRQSAEDVNFRWFASRPPCEASMTSILRNYEAMVVMYANDGGGKKIVGYVEAARDREEPEFVEMGVAVDREYRQKQLASKLIQMLCDACENMGIHKVKAIIMPGNVPMTKLIQRIGVGKHVQRHYEDGCEVYRISSR